MAEVWQTSSEILHGLGSTSLYLELNITKDNEVLRSYQGTVSSKISCDCK